MTSSLSIGIKIWNNLTIKEPKEPKNEDKRNIMVGF